MEDWGRMTLHDKWPNHETLKQKYFVLTLWGLEQLDDGTSRRTAMKEIDFVQVNHLEELQEDAEVLLKARNVADEWSSIFRTYLFQCLRQGIKILHMTPQMQDAGNVYFPCTERWSEIRILPDANENDERNDFVPPFASGMLVFGNLKILIENLTDLSRRSHQYSLRRIPRNFCPCIRVVVSTRQQNIPTAILIGDVNGEVILSGLAFSGADDTHSRPVYRAFDEESFSEHYRRFWHTVGSIGERVQGGLAYNSTLYDLESSTPDKIVRFVLPFLTFDHEKSSRSNNKTTWPCGGGLWVFETFVIKVPSKQLSTQKRRRIV